VKILYMGRWEGGAWMQNCLNAGAASGKYIKREETD
jgi:hypothetical protein